jgi:hypothetical protein
LRKGGVGLNRFPVFTVVLPAGLERADKDLRADYVRDDSRFFLSDSPGVKLSTLGRDRGLGRDPALKEGLTGHAPVRRGFFRRVLSLFLH